MAPSLDGQVHHFQEQGLYDGLFLMMDDETRTFWDHMTGEAMAGPLVGTRLPVSNLLQTNVGQVLGRSPDAQVALSDRILWEEERLTLGGLLSSVGTGLSGLFSSTVQEEDSRRNTMDLGIGIWEGEESRYYPHETVSDEGRALLDEFEGRRVLVYLDPTAFALGAYYVDADGFEWDGDILRLSDGHYVEGGVMYDSRGDRAVESRPLQVFTRWYGFSLTFPDTNVYGEGR
jgi:hypothetical protein